MARPRNENNPVPPGSIKPNAFPPNASRFDPPKEVTLAGDLAKMEATLKEGPPKEEMKLVGSAQIPGQPAPVVLPGSHTLPLHAGDDGSKTNSSGPNLRPFGGDPGPGYISPPSICRVVVFVPDESDLLCKQNGAERLPAIITRVNDNGTVNLKIFCDWMGNQWRPEVPFSEDENEPFSWHWPPRV